MRDKKGQSTIEYLIGAGVIVAIALGAFIYSLLPASENMKEQQPDTYDSDFYQIQDQ